MKDGTALGIVILATLTVSFTLAIYTCTVIELL